MTGSRPHVLAVLPRLIPSTLIYIVKPLVCLNRRRQIDARITLEKLATQRDLQWADVVVLCRNTEPQHASLLDFLLRRKIPFTYDLDDNFFEIPVDVESGGYLRSPERLAMLSRYLEFADLVRVYSEPLLERVKTLNPRVEKIFGPIDLSLVSPPRTYPDPKKVKIVFATSRSQDQLSRIFTPALVRILKEYAGRVEVHFWNFIPPAFRSHPDVHFHRLVRGYDRFIHRFSRMGFDIGLAPLLDDVFHRSKTNIKFREYGACGIAGIYSNVDVYSNCVVDYKTGLLVSNDPEAWYQAMARLIEEPDLREKIRIQTQEFVRDHYSEEDFERIWLKHLYQVMAQKDTQEASAASAAQVLSNGKEFQSGSPPLPCPGWVTLFGLPGNLAKLMAHLREDGLRVTLGMLREYLMGRWGIFKLRLVTSLASKISIPLRTHR